MTRCARTDRHTQAHAIAAPHPHPTHTHTHTRGHREALEPTPTSRLFQTLGTHNSLIPAPPSLPTSSSIPKKVEGRLPAVPPPRAPAVCASLTLRGPGRARFAQSPDVPVPAGTVAASCSRSAGRFCLCKKSDLLGRPSAAARPALTSGALERDIYGKETLNFP